LHVARKISADPATFSLSQGLLLGERAVALSRRIDLLPVRLRHPRSTAFWSPGWHSLRDVTRWPSVIGADVLCFYWTPRGMLGIRQIGHLMSLGKPAIWRLSDMWPFTGGCHYSDDCVAYRDGCGRCPQLRSSCLHDLSRSLFASKRKWWRSGDLTVVSPSRWMAEAARNSPIFEGRDIRVIATGVDTQTFRPLDRNAARYTLGLPLDRPLVIFGADAALRDGRKGGGAVVAVMQRIAAATTGHGPPGLVLFGTLSRPDGIPESIPVHAMGTITDEARLSALYAACDIFLAPSKQENLANTVLESMACGTPVVAFGVGGMNEAIEHRRSGLLVRPADDEALAAATHELLSDEAMRSKLGEQARARALMEFDLHTQTAKYIALYREKIKRAHGDRV
jgi:glycosyltransferase involved in cell wall biosynthesis